jgi:phage protein D
VRDELHIDPAQDGELTPGPLVRMHFLPGRENRAAPSNVPHLDDTRATWNAEGLLRKKARELLTIEATAVGLPRLRPGRHVEIRGYRPPFNGFYYVTRTVHTLGADGLRTRFSASRPGLELPPYRERSSDT